MVSSLTGTIFQNRSPRRRSCFGTVFLRADFANGWGQSLFPANHRLCRFSGCVPLVSIAVPLSGVLAIAGGLSILLGYRAKLGACLIVVFLVPVTLTHRFWTVPDPMMAQIQMVMFMKNPAMLGGALLISQFGAGPFSVDARRPR